MTAPRTFVVLVLLALATTLSPAVAADTETSPGGKPRAGVSEAPDTSTAPHVVRAFDEHPSHARLAPGRKWPGGKITYFDASKDRGAVKRAVKFWNRSGVDITFKKIKSKKKAALVIRNSKRVPSGCGSGLASIGYTKGRQAFVNILHGTDAGGQICAWPGQTLILTHELGHVLGLGHDDSRCAIMNSSHVNGVAPFKCVTPDPADFDERPGHWRCQGPARTDLKRVKRMYGGALELRDEIWCDIVPHMPAGGAVTAVPTGSDAGVTLAVRREPEPALPSFLLVSAITPGYEVHRTADCSAVAGNDATVLARNYWTVAPGADEPLGVDYNAGVPGTRCYQAFALDNLGRYSLASSAPVVVTAL